MDPIVIIVGLISAIAMLNFAAVTNGVDSRDSIADDHRR
jgi:hypothetical protein